MKKPADIAAYLFLALSWGLSFLVLLRVVNAFGLAGAVSFRCLVAALALYAVSLLTRRRLDFSVGWRRLAVVGATTVAGQLVFLSMATPRIGTAMTSIFVAAIPLVSMLISHLLGLERISAHGLAGIALGALGIMMLVGFPSEPVTGTFVLGCGAALLSALFAAYGSNYASLRLKGAGSWETTIGSFLAGGIMTLPLVFAAPVPAWPSPASFGYLLVLGGVMSAMNYVLYFRLVADIGATKAISVEFLVTIVAVAIGTLHLGERLSVLQVCGAGIIMAGCALVLGLFSHDTAKAGR